MRNYLQLRWRRLSRHYRQTVKIALVLLLLGLTARSLPYLAPIRAHDIIQDDRAIEFIDRNGLPLGTILTRDQNHTAVVPLEQISPHFIHAILAAEDGQFYHHGALEIRSIVRSILQAIKHQKIISGASTVTMQLARMLEPAPRTLPAKLREIWLSWRLAAGMSKDEILHAYINRLPMGGNIYGVEAAARIYFALPARELNVAQASLLAAIPNNPNYLNPYDYWEPLKKRQAYVLRRMVEDGYITRTQADRAYTEKVTLHSRRQGIIAAPHFLFWVANQHLKSELSANSISRQGKGNLSNSTDKRATASTIRTTLNRPLQQFVETQVQQVVHSLAPYNAHHAAAVVIDNHSGEVLAYVGSPDYWHQANLGRNDGVQALRQPGSTLKPFLYELALEKQLIRPNTILADIPTHYAIPDAKLYSPTDYSDRFIGPVRVRVALANSLNIPAVRVLEQVGVAPFLERLHQLGFEHLKESADYYGLGLALGSGEVSLWELARAYFIMANQGQSAPLVVYQDAQLSYTASGTDPTSTTWALITDMLSDRHARAQAFGVDSVLNLPFPAAVKTGTSSLFRDTWTVGFTTDYTVATWVGNFDGTPLQTVSGATGAAPLWHRIMLHLHEHREPVPFAPPAGLVQRPICALSGLQPTPACSSVVQEYFYPEDLADYESNTDTVYQVVEATEGQALQYRLNLPDEYDEWLAKRPQANVALGELRILSPRSGDLFLVYPTPSHTTEGGHEQRLEFKIAGATNEPVEWWLNGEKLATQSSNSLFWKLRSGEWTLQVKQGDMSDRVKFEVQSAQTRPTRRGFSVVPSEE